MTINLENEHEVVVLTRGEHRSYWLNPKEDLLIGFVFVKKI